MLLSQPNVELLAAQLTGLATAGALAAEHAALLAVLSSVQSGGTAAVPAGIAGLILSIASGPSAVRCLCFHGSLGITESTKTWGGLVNPEC